MKSNLLNQFQNYVKTHDLFHHEHKLLLACSGGRDSMILAHFLKENNYHFEIAHCNFQLRKEESHEEAQFVQKFCKENNIKFHYKTFETEQYAKENKLSTQLAARQLRYDWFESLKKDHQFDYLLTAHHKSDQLETVLINFINGTGVKGLKGISKKKEFIIRPLLFTDRKSINQYIEEHEIKYKEDSSNASTKYMRNNLRHEIIPKLLEINPSLEKHIQDFSERMIESQSIIDLHIEKELKHILKEENGIHTIDIPRLIKTSYTSTLLKYILKKFNFDSSSWLHEVQKLIQAGSGKSIQNKEYQILKHRKQLLIKNIDDQRNIVQIKNWTNKIHLDSMSLKIGSIPSHKIGKQEKDTVYIDTKTISFPITFRKYKEGDYFYPLGMGMKKKKVKKFFIDQKLSQFDKQDIWIMEDANKKIIWILAHRLDERFEAKKNSKEVIKLSLK